MLIYITLDHSLKLLILKHISLKDWENFILLNGSIQFTFVLNYHTQSKIGQTQMRLVAVFICYPSLQKTSHVLGMGFPVCSFFVSHFKNFLESFRILQCEVLDLTFLCLSEIE